MPADVPFDAKSAKPYIRRTAIDVMFGRNKDLIEPKFAIGGRLSEPEETWAEFVQRKIRTWLSVPACQWTVALLLLVMYTVALRWLLLEPVANTWGFSV